MDIVGIEILIILPLVSIFQSAHGTWRAKCKYGRQPRTSSRHFGTLLIFNTVFRFLNGWFVRYYGIVYPPMSPSLHAINNCSHNMLLWLFLFTFGVNVLQGYQRIRFLHTKKFYKMHAGCVCKPCSKLLTTYGKLLSC